ncbi:MAG: hypothetical protein WKH64_17850 [Chloroflexia bacterium]
MLRAGQLQNTSRCSCRTCSRSRADRTNWYKTQKRDLSLGLDKEKRHGALVFPYCFEGEAGVLRAVFDQKSKSSSSSTRPSYL